MKNKTTPLFFDKYANTFNQEIEVTGPGVDGMIQAIQHMLILGPPNERNDIGGSGVSYPVFTALAGFAPGMPMKWRDVIRGMQALQIHKNTQLPVAGIDYEQLRTQVVTDYNQALAAAGQNQVQENTDRKHITFLGPINNGGFVSYAFRIFDLKRYPEVKNAIRAEMDRRADEGESHYGKTTDNYGKFDNPIWKAWKKSKSHLDAFEIDPKFVAIVEPALRAKGYDTSEMVSSLENVETAAPTKKISATLSNNSIIVDFNGYPGRDAMTACKEAGFRGSKTPEGNFIWTNNNPQAKPIEAFIDFMETMKYDCSELRALMAPLKEEEADTGDRIRIRARDVSAETKGRWHMAISFLRKGTPEGELLKEAIRFSFPAWTKNLTDPIGGRTVNTDTWETFVAGTQQEYFNFMNTLDKRGFYTADVVNILNNLTKSGLIKNQIGIGIVDGYENDEEFFADLDNYKLPFQLYPEQKEAIKRLYSHSSFMRGDETGAGKTVTGVLAADMRMRQSGGRSVVVTKVAVQDQFMDAIAEFTGLDRNDPTQISTNPLDNATWTVLTYNQFSQPPQTEVVVQGGKRVQQEIVEPGRLNGRVQFTNELVRQATNGEIQCVILDELHNVKNGRDASKDTSPNRKHKSNHTTFNVQDFTDKVPFSWGLSATIVANKPIDVYNQLKAVGHPLGNLSWGRFASDFGGMKMGNYGMEKGTIDEQLEAVSKLKEYLFDQEAYDALGKKQLNEDLPDQIVSQDSIPVNQDILWNRIAKRVAGFKKPDLAVSQMQAFRNEAAIIKAPQTVRDAIPTLEKGEKIMIFSDFKDSLEEIRSGIQAYFDQKGKGEQVVTIKGGMRKKTRRAAIEAFKDENSNARAIVINIVAGGTGLDFPNIVTQAIVNDYDWSVANDEQMLGRNYRINSLHDVYVKYMIAEDTPDEEYYERLTAKKQIADVIHKMSREEDARMKDGERGQTSAELKALQKELAEMKKRYIQMESKDKTFEAEMARKIRGGIKKNASKNWYGNKKFGK
jgi:superfamily II DNA or RNA helicase